MTDPFAEGEESGKQKTLAELQLLIDRHTVDARKAMLATKDFALLRTRQGTLHAFVTFGKMLEDLKNAGKKNDSE